MSSTVIDVTYWKVVHWWLIKILYYKQKVIFWKRPRRKTEQNFDSEMIVSHHWDVNLEEKKKKSDLRICQQKYFTVEMGKQCRKKQKAFNWNSKQVGQLSSRQTRWNWENTEQHFREWLGRDSHLMGLGEYVQCGPAKQTQRRF